MEGEVFKPGLNFLTVSFEKCFRLGLVQPLFFSDQLKSIFESRWETKWNEENVRSQYGHL